MECAGQKNGFVTFKKSSWKSKSDDTVTKDNKVSKSTAVKIPNHLLQKMNTISQASARKSSAISNHNQVKGSKEFRSEADKIRAELAELKKQREMLTTKSK